MFTPLQLNLRIAEKTVKTCHVRHGGFGILVLQNGSSHRIGKHIRVKTRIQALAEKITNSQGIKRRTHTKI